MIICQWAQLPTKAINDLQTMFRTSYEVKILYETDVWRQFEMYLLTLLDYFVFNYAKSGDFRLFKNKMLMSIYEQWILIPWMQSLLFVSTILSVKTCTSSFRLTHQYNKCIVSAISVHFYFQTHYYNKYIKNKINKHSAKKITKILKQSHVPNITLTSISIFPEHIL